jgi:REP element-mobilizing transposase RayT
MLEALAYFLTWTTYGSWLPGDARRWVHKRGSAAMPYREPDSKRAQFARQLMKQTPVRLDSIERRTVGDAIRRACAFKGWALGALNVLSNHVHVVVTAAGERPECVMVCLKAWASRRLNESRGGGSGGRWWTRHGSTRYLNTPEALQQAVEYVVNQ